MRNGGEIGIQQDQLGGKMARRSLKPAGEARMARVANYTIKGFLYQFNVTLLAILDSQENSVTTVEGLIEDIDIADADQITAFQCKYHESVDRFVLSIVYEPILQMMLHFKNNPRHNIAYVLYAHFPNEPDGEKQLTIPELNRIIDSSDGSLQKYTSQLKNNFDTGAFHKQFKLIMGYSYDTTVADVQERFAQNGMEPGDIDVLVYPNAITIIGDLSIQKDEAKRKITKAGLLAILRSKRTIAISRWAAALKSYSKLLKAKRKQLKANLDKNVRVRHIFLSQGLDQFKDEIVIFIHRYLQKYHFKPCHLNTPLFCFDCNQQLFEDICRRLISKKIKINDGILVGAFDKQHFLRDPVTNPSKKIREFDLRITTLDIAMNILNENICDDLYLVAPHDNLGINPLDVNVERLAVKNFKEVRYLFWMDSNYE